MCNLSVSWWGACLRMTRAHTEEGVKLVVTHLQAEGRRNRPKNKDESLHSSTPSVEANGLTLVFQNDCMYIQTNF